MFCTAVLIQHEMPHARVCIRPAGQLSCLPLCLQEYFLHALSQPRPHASLDLMQQQCKDELGSGMRRSQSYHGLDPLGIPSAVYGAMHDIHASFVHVAQGVKSKKQGAPSWALPQSKRASFRSSDGGAAGASGPSPGGLSPAGGAAHPVISMLAEQVRELCRTHFGVCTALCGTSNC